MRVILDPIEMVVADGPYYYSIRCNHCEAFNEFGLEQETEAEVIQEFMLNDYKCWACNKILRPLEVDKIGER